MKIQIIGREGIYCTECGQDTLTVHLQGCSLAPVKDAPAPGKPATAEQIAAALGR